MVVEYVSIHGIPDGIRPNGIKTYWTTGTIDRIIGVESEDEASKTITLQMSDNNYVKYVGFPYMIKFKYKET